MPAQISIEFDPPFSSAANSTQKHVQEPESSESQSEIVPSIEVRPPSPPLTSISPVSNDAQTTSSTSQGFLSIDSGVRLRSSSQDSHHSVPKSWSDFESEAKTWKVSWFRSTARNILLGNSKPWRKQARQLIREKNLVTRTF